MTTILTSWHSQLQQDEWVIEKTDGQRHGYFVEIGGYDGLHHSNTLALERQYDWTGLLVEPNPLVYPKLVANRPDCKHANVAVGPREGLQDFICGETYSGLVEYMPDSWCAEHRRRGNPLATVETITLHQLLDVPFAPIVIDYLSLDVEGAEYAILEKYLHTSMFPSIRLMTVEYRGEQETLDKLVALLEPYFDLDKVHVWDAFFVNKVLA